jgi:hypothetical protein
LEDLEKFEELEEYEIWGFVFWQANNERVFD